MYRDGEGVQADLAESIKWLTFAADQKYVPAVYALGFIFEHGDGVAQDLAKAAAYYKMAAERGNTDAQFRLGSLYRYGRGVAQDSAQAYFWIKLAATLAQKGNALDAATQIAAELPPDVRASQDQIIQTWKAKP